MRQSNWTACCVLGRRVRPHPDATEGAGAPRGSVLPRSMMTVLLRSPSCARPMFSGLTSRWAYPAACIESSPRRRHRPTTLHSNSESSPPRAVRASRSVPPLINLRFGKQANAAGAACSLSQHMQPCLRIPDAIQRRRVFEHTGRGYALHADEEAGAAPDAALAHPRRPVAADAVDAVAAGHRELQHVHFLLDVRQRQSVFAVHLLHRQVHALLPTPPPACRLIVSCEEVAVAWVATCTTLAEQHLAMALHRQRLLALRNATSGKMQSRRATPPAVRIHDVAPREITAHTASVAASSWPLRGTVKSLWRWQRDSQGDMPRRATAQAVRRSERCPQTPPGAPASG